LASEISNLILVKDKDAYSVDDSITLNVKFSLSGEMRDVFNEKNWTDAYEKNDNQFKLKYGIKLVSSGLRKHDVGKPIDTYRKASVFWTRNPKLVNPMKEKRIWVQVAKNFEPIIKLTEEDVQKELFDFDEPIILSASELGKGKHKIVAEVFASWNKHAYIEKSFIKMKNQFWYRVRVGSYDNYDTAVSLATAISTTKNVPTWVDNVRNE